VMRNVMRVRHEGKPGHTPTGIIYVNGINVGVECECGKEFKDRAPIPGRVYWYQHLKGVTNDR
jgi:hypothetical protein